MLQENKCSCCEAVISVFHMIWQPLNTQIKYNTVGLLHDFQNLNTKMMNHKKHLYEISAHQHIDVNRSQAPTHEGSGGV